MHTEIASILFVKNKDLPWLHFGVEKKDKGVEGGGGDGTFTAQLIYKLNKLCNTKFSIS